MTNSHPSFIAMEYYLGILNRTYRVFYTPDIVAGAYVRGIMAAPVIIPPKWFEPETWINHRLDKKYQSIDPESTAFLRKTPYNFQYHKADITNSWYDPSKKWGMGSVSHSGKLYLTINSNKTREFILLGLQQGKDILRRHHSRRESDNFQDDDPALNELLAQVYAAPSNRPLWISLAKHFERKGETAQSFYCYTQISRLR